MNTPQLIGLAFAAVIIPVTIIASLAACELRNHDLRRIGSGVASQWRATLSVWWPRLRSTLSTLAVVALWIGWATAHMIALATVAGWEVLTYLWRVLRRASRVLTVAALGVCGRVRRSLCRASDPTREAIDCAVAALVDGVALGAALAGHYLPQILCPAIDVAVTLLQEWVWSICAAPSILSAAIRPVADRAIVAWVRLATVATSALRIVISVLASLTRRAAPHVATAYSVALDTAVVLTREWTLHTVDGTHQILTVSTEGVGRIAEWVGAVVWRSVRLCAFTIVLCAALCAGAVASIVALAWEVLRPSLRPLALRLFLSLPPMPSAGVDRGHSLPRVVCVSRSTSTALSGASVVNRLESARSAPSRIVHPLIRRVVLWLLCDAAPLLSTLTSMVT